MKIILSSKKDGLLILKFLLLVDRWVNNKLSNKKFNKLFNKRDKTALINYVKQNKFGVYPDINRFFKLLDKAKVYNESYEDDTNAILENISYKFKDKWSKLDKDIDISKDNLKLIKDYLTYFNKRAKGKDYSAAFKRIKTNVNKVIDEPTLLRLYYEDILDKVSKAISFKKESFKRMKQIANKIGKKDKFFHLSNDDKKELEKIDPELKKEYNKLKREINTYFNEMIKEYFRGKGKKLLLLGKVRSIFSKKGFAFKFPEGGDDLLIDEDLWYYAPNGKKLTARIPAGAKIIMNPKYHPDKDDTYVCESTIPASIKENATQKYYTLDFKYSNKNKVFEKVDTLLKNLNKYRKQWLKDMTSRDKKKKLLATIVELVYKTQGRIGKKGNVTTSRTGKKTKTYGISTLMGKHIKFKDDGSILISYVGKDAVRHKHKIENISDNALLIKNLKSFAKNKDKNDYVFSLNGGKSPVSPSAVNSYLKDNLDLNITIHKFRHIEGTKLAKELLSKNPFKNKKSNNPKKVEEWFKKQMEKIGKKLGHIAGTKVSWSTAKDNYVEPSLMLKFFKDSKVRTPKFLEKFDKE